MPIAQNVPALQISPQVPQFRTSLIKSTQEPLQFGFPEGQTEQFPLAHNGLVEGQVLEQVPQYLVLVFRSTQTPLQRVFLEGQLQMPLTHEPPVQVLLQAPQ